MDDSTKIEDHVCLMRSWYDGLRQINDQNVKPFDWAIQLPASLPSSWDVFIQTIQHNLRDLSDATKHDEVMKTIMSKVMAEGQRREKKEGESAMFAQQKGHSGFISKNHLCYVVLRTSVSTVATYLLYTTPVCT
ncbi:hypothetical protein FRC08_007112 [Ceratobasidium sp. 394]|nr:hypothetical protein FRC08_007112 [Ceratobasidium sp. 394]